MPAKHKQDEPEKGLQRKCCVCPYCEVEIIEEPAPFCRICSVEFIRCSQCGMLVMDKTAVVCSRCGGGIKRG